MDSVIKKLADIEAAAEAIVEHAQEQKSVVEKELQAKRDQFDQELEEKTQERIEKIRKNGEDKMNSILEEQRVKNRATIQKLEQEYEENHVAYTEEILKHIIEV